MIQAWRIVKEKHAPTAFNGEGARLFGGRWNSRGTSMVYTSATLSLATLESLVHLTPPIVFNYVFISIEFDKTLVETVDPATLNFDWKDSPPPLVTQSFGDQWIREARSAVLKLPSTIIPTEYNYLINPVHRDFKKIRLSTPVKFSFDPRLKQ